MGQEAKLAVLIDAENIAAKNLDAIMSEIATLGRAVVRRAYGNWTAPQMGSWKSLLLSYAIHPVQQFHFTSGKNATDSNLIIDAMDLMYTKHFDGFCIISSDSDFTRLAQRIREQGLFVYGFGCATTPKSLMRACDKFTYIEIFEEDGKNPKDAIVDFYDSADFVFSKNVYLKPIDSAIALVKQSIEHLANEQGFVNIGPLKNHILKIEPDFDTRLFGCEKFSDFLKAYPRYFTLQSFTGKNNHKNILVKITDASYDSD